MLQLSSEQIKSRNEITRRLTEGARNVEDALCTLNDEMTSATEAVEDAVSRYNAVVEAAGTWGEAIAKEQQEYFDAMTPSWQQDARGLAYAAWMDNYADVIGAIVDASFESPEEVSIHEDLFVGDELMAIGIQPKDPTPPKPTPPEYSVLKAYLRAAPPIVHHEFRAFCEQMFGSVPPKIQELLTL